MAALWKAKSTWAAIYHSSGNSANDLFGAFVPGLVTHTDLPEVAVSVAPRRITLAGAIDAAGKKLAAGEVASLYGAAGNVKVLPDADWSAAALASAAADH